MRCELCGNETNSARPVYIEGSKLSVCPSCARFGDEHRGGKANLTGSRVGNASVIEERLEKRKRRMSSKDVYAGQTEELIVEYQEAIKDARRKKDWDQETLARNISEKKSVIMKVEAGSLTPSDNLVKKLEKALDIKLTETVQSAGGQKGGRGGGTMTLGDFIRKE